jgi:hypothetical protein
MSLLQQNKKGRESGTSKNDEDFKMNAHHAPLRQSVEEIRLGKEQEEGGTIKSRHVVQGNKV